MIRCFNGCLRIQWPTGQHIFSIYGDLGVQSKRHITILLVWRLTAGVKRPGALLHHPNAPSLHSMMITTNDNDMASKGGPLGRTMSTTSTGEEGDTRPSRPVSDDAVISKPKGILAVDGKQGERTRINLPKSNC